MLGEMQGLLHPAAAAERAAAAPRRGQREPQQRRSEAAVWAERAAAAEAARRAAAPAGGAALGAEDVAKIAAEAARAAVAPSTGGEENEREAALRAEREAALRAACAPKPPTPTEPQPSPELTPTLYTIPLSPSPSTLVQPGGHEGAAADAGGRTRAAPGWPRHCRHCCRRLHCCTVSIAQPPLSC